MHRSPKLKSYSKKLDHSYAFGVYPSIDLLKYRPESLIKVLIKSGTSADSEKISDFISQVRELGVPVEENDRAIEKIAHKENTYIVSIFEKFVSPISTDSVHVVLDQPRNMGNIGTIIRTMVGMGFTELALIKPAADIYDPKVVRSAMGAFFQINFKYFDSFDQYQDFVGERKIFSLMLDGAVDIRDSSININEETYSLVFGNESRGLSEEFRNKTTPVFIPQFGDIDSLNLSVAAAMTMWEIKRGHNL